MDQNKRKPFWFALAASVFNRKMYKGPFPIYCEPVRMFLFYNLFKGASDFKVDNTPSEETVKPAPTKTVPMSQSEIKKTSPFVKINLWDPRQAGILETVLYLRYLLRDVNEEKKKHVENTEKRTPEEIDVDNQMILMCMMPYC
ncbi:uncharacterized protein LOC123674986 [Harmonia axyridis]|uniref:uncharacterized protein LOC123674986 n=1 Tax=Harmonia axyridis TaxID=115357 RepID=UPI001E27696F|nr:uncharacterized protein LOC123674986 [Harmonia axyridis]XP_045466157.1 uncharacterized protein LOC123674986 [Harmonia axyridis]